MGPTVDSVDCELTGTCPSKPFSRFLVTLVLLAAPLAVVMGTILYFVYKRINLESQLVDYWWKISYKDIEIVETRRKNAGDGSSCATGAGGSQVSSHVNSASRIAGKPNDDNESDSRSPIASGVARTTITKGTSTSAYASTAADVCYGEISLGVYKLAKVALKPISKFHQSRKLMVELRTVSFNVTMNIITIVDVVLALLFLLN